MEQEIKPVEFKAVYIINLLKYTVLELFLSYQSLEHIECLTDMYTPSSLAHCNQTQPS